MKKFGLLIAGGIAAIVLLSNLGPLLALGLSIVLLYFVFKQFLKTDSLLMKIGWGFIGFIALMASASNLPAIIGIVAAYVLYLVYKKWNQTKTEVKVEENDPFTNFEKQWAEFKKN
ncbi:flagellar basal body rod protein [Cytobacillus depressus]|uniref:Flagellar basal body rod protein n=1 Tax=Cytobacillus depressus TaxID=1602942 RepID=A0A6L3V6E9_9BACI|nr:flagellar basal body rod protein [Cytobacillus depressus]KAB2336042.1 flagellar basal body rod protein [Cytobacillus depressus]